MKSHDEKVFEALLSICFSDTCNEDSYKFINKAIEDDTIFHEQVRLLPAVYKKASKSYFS
jgi:hypothetical protein